MKCSDISKMYGLPETDPHHAEVQAHLRGCFICRARWDDQDALRRLIALKRYEQPAPGLEARCLAAIHLRLAAQPENTGWWRTTLSAWPVAFQPAQLVWAAAAAVLLLLGGVYVLTPPSGSPGPARPAPALALEGHILIQPPDAPPLTLPGVPPMVVAASNREPARMDYGPGAAVPVNYPY
ncbi:MAG: hypothetical protein NTV49_06650 [Kiritimatiellaeota bacterium]|nr:hypothetical protein [Kiritimatiellota bacterium]